MLPKYAEILKHDLHILIFSGDVVSKYDRGSLCLSWPLKLALETEFQSQALFSSFHWIQKVDYNMICISMPGALDRSINKHMCSQHFGLSLAFRRLMAWHSIMQDGIVPVTGTRRWIRKLGLNIEKPWKSWHSGTGIQDIAHKGLQQSMLLQAFPFTSSDFDFLAREPLQQIIAWK